MNCYHYRNQNLYIEDVSLSEIAEDYGTPCYVYSEKMLATNFAAFSDELKNLPARICYAVKANSNIAILNWLAQRNCGFDIVSKGELLRVLAAKGDPKNVVFSGVGKQKDEIIFALQQGIYCFNLESVSELERLDQITREQKITTQVIVRLNPDIDAATHPYIATGLRDNKFGINLDDLDAVFAKLKDSPYLKLIGVGCHIGSQLTTLQPFLSAMDCLLNYAEKLQQNGFEITTLNIGGGLGIRYQDEKPPQISDYLDAIKAKMQGKKYEIIFEPGRALIANTGVLLTRVEYLKHNHHKNFAIVDAAMNDLIRPALYGAWQEILPVTRVEELQEQTYDVVGPVCESADFLGKNRPLKITEGSLLAISNAGAYGFAMSSNYNSRPRAAEILVQGNKTYLIRKREITENLFALESLIS